MDSFLLSTLWDIAKNVVGNRVDAALFTPSKATQTMAPQAPEAPMSEQSKSVRMFKTYDAVHDLVQVVNFVDKPVLH